MKSSSARSVPHSVLGVSLLALCGMAFAASGFAASNQEPVYNPSTEVRISAVITGVRQVPDGPLAGVHLSVQPKSGGSTDVYLGPADFIRFFKTDFPTGAAVQVIGSRVTSGSGEVVLAREITEGATTLTLREFTGVPVWQHWGVETSNSAASTGF